MLLIEAAALGAVAVVAAVVGEVGLFTGGVLALVNLPAECGRPACEDTPDGPVVGSVELAAMGTGVVGPVLTQEVCEGECHLAVEARWCAFRLREGWREPAAPGLRSWR